MNLMKREAGFTILEVLFSLMIFSFGILAVASMQLTSFSGNNLANISSEATTLAAGKIDELLSMRYFPSPGDANFNAATYDPLYALSDRSADGVAGLGDETVATADHNEIPPGTQGNYQLFWNVADNVPAQDMKSIQVIVLWTGSKGRQHRVTLNTTKISGDVND